MKTTKEVLRALLALVLLLLWVGCCIGCLAGIVLLILGLLVEHSLLAVGAGAGATVIFALLTALVTDFVNYLGKKGLLGE